MSTIIGQDKVFFYVFGFDGHYGAGGLNDVIMTTVDFNDIRRVIAEGEYEYYQVAFATPTRVGRPAFIVYELKYMKPHEGGFIVQAVHPYDGTDVDYV